ncbi:hypothetical protein FA13DRAFT_1795184 [Coprinellus micaceus]|uniref:Uncharacterized protein n=1 Tax=Coprinellus micaceus TaxID=71717 RepID=A0A4Y7SYK2_COPMI|nr:hypothetical protein FA13DRAFT_1795184 [Coprinellus micaceus]
MSTHIAVDDPSAKTLLIHNPIVTILCCEGKAWLCIGEVNAIKVDGASVEEVVFGMLSEEFVSISFQVSGLRPSTSEEDTTAKLDWRTSTFPETTFTVPSRYVEPINPITASLPSKPSLLFYLLDSSFLNALGESLYSKLSVSELKSTPKIALSKDFPYREVGGKACFICEDECQISDLGLANMIECKYCDPLVALDTSQGKMVLEHMAAHIQHDPKVKKIDQPCGICLRPAPICQFYLEKSKGANGGDRIDQWHSICKHQVQFHYSKASKATTASPSIWKYNLPLHFKHTHLNRSLDGFPDLNWSLTNFEREEIRKRWVKRQATPRRVRKKGDEPQFVISDAHRSDGGGMRPTNLDVHEVMTTSHTVRFDDGIEASEHSSSENPESEHEGSESPASLSQVGEGTLEDQLEEGGFREDDLDGVSSVNNSMAALPSQTVPVTHAMGITSGMLHAPPAIPPASNPIATPVLPSDPQPAALSTTIPASLMASSAPPPQIVPPPTQASGSNTEMSGTCRSGRERIKQVLEIDTCVCGEVAGPRDVQRRPYIKCVKKGCETVTCGLCWLGNST